MRSYGVEGEKKEEVLEALAQTHGIWKDDEGIAVAFREVERNGINGRRKSRREGKQVC